jgi:hypothetical protein
VTTRKVIRRQVRVDRKGLSIAADVNAVVSAGENSTATSHTETSIVQRRGRQAQARAEGSRRTDG